MFENNNYAALHTAQIWRIQQRQAIDGILTCGIFFCCLLFFMLVCTRPFDQIILLLFYFVSDVGLHETISSSIIFIVFFVSYIHMRFF